MKNSNKKLTDELQVEILNILKERFEKNKQRHHDLNWKDVQLKLEKNLDKLYSLNQMEKTDGEPDVIGFDKKTGEFIFVDCADETPKSRRSICYDQLALESRKVNKPIDSAMNMAIEMGVDLLNEQEYRYLQTLGVFDAKTSSWVKTPNEIRQLGGAIFCDRRYDTVFTYHNGAESYYGGRGFRAILKV